MVVGRWQGVGPVSGKAFDEPAVLLAAAASSRSAVTGSPAQAGPGSTSEGELADRLPRAVISGTAAQIYLYLWGRLPGSALTREGDAGVLAVLDARLEAGIE